MAIRFDRMPSEISGGYFGHTRPADCHCFAHTQRSLQFTFVSYRWHESPWRRKTTEHCRPGFHIMQHSIAQTTAAVVVTVAAILDSAIFGFGIK